MLSVFSKSRLALLAILLLVLSGCTGLKTKPVLGLSALPCRSEEKGRDHMSLPCELSGTELFSKDGSVEVSVTYATPGVRSDIIRREGLKYDPFSLAGEGKNYLVFRLTITNYGASDVMVQPLSSFMSTFHQPGKPSLTALDYTILWSSFERYRIQHPSINEDLKRICYYQSFSLPPHSKVTKLLVFDDFPPGNPNKIRLVMPTLIVDSEPKDFQFPFEVVYVPGS